jgi:tripartite-type tricarboxylate transporter receptor subunit TctC
MRKALCFVSAMLLLTALNGSAHADQPYPIRPIRLIVPFPAGGGVDIVARLISQKLTESFKTAIVVDNRAGAAGVIGTEILVRAAPDGYTLIAVEGGYAGNAAAFKLSYDPVRDVTPIALIAQTPFIVTLHPSIPAVTVKELIAYDKANPGKVHYGSGGTASINQLVAELFNQKAGTHMTHVPYKGVGLALNELLGGQIQLIIGGLPPMLPHIKANRLRGLAVTSEKRSPIAPEFPPVADSVPGYEAMQWFAILGPKGLPPAIVARWNEQIDRILQSPDLSQRMANDGLEPAGGPPDRFRDVLQREISKWQQVVAAAGIKPERY